MTNQKQLASTFTTDNIIQQTLSFLTNSHHETFSNDKQNQHDLDTFLQTNSSDSRLDGNSMIPLLPNEIISSIFEYLSEGNQQRTTIHACALVNKHFHAIANPLLWRTIDFYDYDTRIDPIRFFDSISDAATQRLSTLFGHIEHLVLDRYDWSDAQFLRVLPHLTHLKHLSLVGSVSITDTSFQHVPQLCPQLTSLGIHLLDLSETSFLAIGQGCHRLSKMDWSLTRNQSIDWLGLLADCPLEHLRLWTRDNLDVNPTWTESALLKWKAWERLTRLEMNVHIPGFINCLLRLAATNSNHHLTLDNNNNNGTAHGWWPLLTNVSLNFEQETPKASLIEFFKSHPNIQELELCEFDTLADTAIDAMMTWLPNLKTVNMIDNDLVVSRGTIRRLISKCRYLEHVAVNAYLCGFVAPRPSEEGDPAESFEGLWDLATINNIRQNESN